jgi:hypothetical protein
MPDSLVLIEKHPVGHLSAAYLLWNLYQYVRFIPLVHLKYIEYVAIFGFETELLMKIPVSKRKASIIFTHANVREIASRNDRGELSATGNDVLQERMKS